MFLLIKLRVEVKLKEVSQKGGQSAIQQRGQWTSL